MWGIGIQYAMALITLRTSAGVSALQWLGDQVEVYLVCILQIGRASMPTMCANLPLVIVILRQTFGILLILATNISNVLHSDFHGLHRHRVHFRFRN